MQPRVFKQEHLPGLTRADMHEMMVAYGMLEFERRGAAPFMWIIKSGPHVYWIETPWENEIEKEASVEILKNLMVRMEADAYSFMSEAWEAVYHMPPGADLDLDAITMPAKLPPHQREDVLLVYSFDRKGDFDTSRFLVTVRDNGRNYLGPRDDNKEEAEGGRMWNLFK